MKISKWLHNYIGEFELKVFVTAFILLEVIVISLLGSIFLGLEFFINGKI